jgi:Flp pilus assembly protein TadD
LSRVGPSRALALIALCALGCAGPRLPLPALDGWHAVESHGVRIVADANPDELRALARDLAAFDAAFAFLIGRQIPATGPTTIALIRDAGLQSHFGLGRGVAGFALVTLDGSLACVERFKSPAATRQVLYHEYTHLLLSRHHDARIPRWYNEGLADYFGTLDYRDGALVVGSVTSERLISVVKSKPMPLAKLFGGDRDATLRGAVIGDFYATSWALIHYLLQSPKGRGELSRFERELAKGTPLEEARTAAFGRPFAQLDEELATHVGYLARGVAAVSVIDPKKITVAEPPAAVPLPRGDVARELGSLALAVSEESADEDESDEGLSDLARALLQFAVDEDPANSRARAALARARALGGDAKGADEMLVGALRDAPGDAQVLLAAGQLALAAKADADAQARFRSAIAADQRSPSAWFGLGRALAHAGDTDAALDALTHARKLGWSAPLALELGRLHVAARRADEARALLQPLAADPHGGAIGKKAAALLEELDAPHER